MTVGDTYVFPGFLTSVQIQLFFPRPPTTYLTCFCRGERGKYAGEKSRLNWGSNSQPPGHESDTLTTEPPGQGTCLENVLPISSNLKLSSANSFSLEESKMCRLGKGQNATQIFASSWLLLSPVFQECWQHRSNTRLQVLCSLILIYTGCTDNYNGKRHFNPFPNDKF